MSELLLERQQVVPCGKEEAFGFFSDAYNLELITPPFLRFKILDVRPAQLCRDALIDYRLVLHGFPIRWRTRIESWEPPHAFVDVQLKGPYALWHHTHTFESVDDGTLIRDRIRYRLPLGTLGRIVAGRLVEHDLRRIFDYRRDATARILGESPKSPDAEIEP